MRTVYIVTADDGAMLASASGGGVETRVLTQALRFTYPLDAHYAALFARLRLEGNGLPKRRGWQVRRMERSQERASAPRGQRERRTAFDGMLTEIEP